MGSSKGKKRWIKYRHRVVRNIAYAVLSPYAKIKYGIHVERFKEQGKRPYLILMNHQTAFDQFFIGMTFKGAVYYVASEDLFSNGWVSSLLRWLVAPIPIKKQTADVSAVLACARVAKEGGTIAIAPEGNRTYSGRIGYMNPAIASLAMHLKLPIALVRIEGGYGVQPRWSDVVRKGSMRVGVARVIEPQEYEKMSRQELLSEIETTLWVDEAKADGTYKSAELAQYLERAMYVCPYCGLSEFESRGCEIECKKCGRKIRYGTDKRLSGVGFDFPFEFVGGWYDYQEEFVRKLDLDKYIDSPIYKDTANLSKVIVYKRKERLCENASVELYGDKIIISGEGLEKMILSFDEVSAVTVLGRNKLNIYHGKDLYQLKGGKRFNALKYVNIYYCRKDVRKGDMNGKFLGL